MDHKDLCEHTRIRLIAAAIGLQQCTKTESNIVHIPGGERVIAIGTPAQVRGMLGADPAHIDTQLAAARAAGMEEAASLLDRLNESSGDAAAYDGREQTSWELSKEAALSDAAAAIRALATQAAPTQATKLDRYMEASIELDAATDNLYGQAPTRAVLTAMDLCPKCGGSGEEKMLVGGGPDAYEIDSNCSECGGIGDAAQSVSEQDERALFEAARKRIAEDVYAMRLSEVESEERALFLLWKDGRAHSHQAAQGSGVQADKVRDALELYADSYASMSRQNGGVCKVDCVSVEYDIRRNMVDSVLAVLAASPAPSAAPLQWEARRFCKGDDEWTAWAPIAPEEYERRKGDASFEFRAAPAQAAQGDDSAAEFLSKRLARVARSVGHKMPEGPHEFIAGVAGTILGDIARKLETSRLVPATEFVNDGKDPDWDAYAAAEAAPAAQGGPLTKCAAGRDGECDHAQCPQLRDGEPAASGRHCPLDTVEDEE